MSDIVVTGLGATTPLGGDVASSWAALLEGRSGIGLLTEDWAAQMPARVIGRLAVEPSKHIDRVRARRLDRCQQVALIAAREAWADAGSPEVDPERLAVVVGTGVGGALTMLAQDDVLEETGPSRVSPLTIPMLMPNGSAATIGLELHARAGVHTPVSACAAGSEGIAMGMDIIRAGRADVVVAGGAEACIHPLPMAGFSRMRALSTRNDDPEQASRPFDKGRDGFVLGEGAGLVVLERAEFARARGARIYAVLAGAGVSNDSFDMVQPHPEGCYAALAIRLALRNAGIDAAEIGHVNAHATATPVGDLTEAGAILSAIGDGAAVAATKSMTGHMLGASGAVEAIFTILALRDQIVPGTQNATDLDDDPRVQALDIVRGAPRKATLRAAVNDSFGFGGHNVALVFTAA
ncbi:MAG: beta-ketoacyl-[acyl-carrier-protein] synthase family protein [Geodermatophilaceae bacterium]|nr:beta-ketoacyl-[acyl-carrier-protein] synthase family protein [Geodermatophilaceae bacterium]